MTNYASNVNAHGGDFFDVIKSSMLVSENIEIATGYIGARTIDDFNGQMVQIAENGGISKLLVGMAFYEGFKGRQKSVLNDLNDNLKDTGNQNGVYISISGRYHGKIYSFDIANNKNYFVGSSNFSYSGLKTNREFNVKVTDTNDRIAVQHYLDYLFHSENCARIDKVLLNTASTIKRNIGNDYNSLMAELNRYEPKTINREDLELAFSFPLEHSAKQGKSHLNKYFAKGRVNNRTGIITPRPWYEVELISPKPIREKPDYPIGKFNAYTNDGYIIPMHTSGDYNKNIESRNGLRYFGAWLKGKLEISGALEKPEPFNMDVLSNYGVSEIKFYKIVDGSVAIPNFFLEF